MLVKVGIYHINVVGRIIHGSSYVLEYDQIPIVIREHITKLSYLRSEGQR